MLFPSLFEGFGLPPVEAQYCNVPCVCFDLPVLREVSGNGLVYVELGNWSQFRSKIKEVLDSGQTYEHLRDNIANLTTIESYLNRINQLVSRVMQQPKSSKQPANKFFIAMDLLKRCYLYVFWALWRLLRAAVLEPVNILWGLFLRLIIRPPLRAILMRLFPDMPGKNIKEEAIHYFRKLILRK